MHGYWNFAEETSRLALLGKSTLIRLFRYFSAAVLSETITHTVERISLLDLRRTLGDELYRYVLVRGRYQAGSIRHDLIPFARGDSFAEQLNGVSAASLLIIASAWPTELTAFLDEHDPEYFLHAKENIRLHGEANTLIAAAGPAQRRSLWFILKKILLREVSPEWAPCFD